MDELFPTIHIDELFPSVNMDELYFIIYFDEHFPSVNMEDLYSTIYYDELYHQSTWTSSTLQLTLTSSPICQHGRALLCFSHRRALPSVKLGGALLYYLLGRALPKFNMDELYSAFHINELSHQSTWRSSSLLFTLTSSPISQHGGALLYYLL